MKRFLKNISLAAAAAIFAVSSCQVADVDKFDINGNANGPSFTLRVNRDDSDIITKAGISGLNPYWKTGDELWVSDGTNSTKAVVPAEYNGKSYAEIMVGGLDSTATIYAIYPYDEEAVVKNGNLIMNIDMVQNGTFDQAYHAVGKKTSTESSINMKNACAILRYESNREDIAGLQFTTASDVAISGKFEIDTETGAKTGSEDAQKSIVVNYKNKRGEQYIGLIASDIPAGSKMTFVTKDGSIGELTLGSENSLKNGVLYNLGNIDNKIKFSTEPVQDLSERESANCYIIKTPGAYRFKAVQGNSTTSVGKAVSATTVWESENSTKAPALGSIVGSAMYCADYVYVNIPENAPAGNALVAVRNSKGEILWSWHLWISKEDIVDQEWSGSSFSGAIMMDRNLGALSATPGSAKTNGLFYQYGRKDPFPGAAATGNTETKVQGTAMKVVSVSDLSGTIEYATAHPTDFLYQASWWLWDDRNDTWSATRKTIYDPCPPGYHIPFGTAFDGFTKTNAKWENKGRIITINGQTVFFPAAGSRNTGSGTLTSVGGNVYYWVDENTSTDKKTNFVYGTSSKFGIQATLEAHAKGFSVRCQKDVATDKQIIRLEYNITETELRTYAPYFPTKSFKPIYIVWGSGDAEEEYEYQHYIWHKYEQPGTYSLIVESAEMDSFTLNPVGEIEALDVTSF